jgi:integrase
VVKGQHNFHFEDINLDYYYKYTSFLKKEGLAQNAISKDIQIIKTIMREAIDLSFTSNIQFMNKKFAVHRIETDAVFLTDKEILTLFNYDFSYNKRLEQVKDLFVFGCCVGRLRFSDYSTVQPENIVQIDGDHFIKLITKKTGELVIIPCNPIVMQIFLKYESSPNKLPKTISNQKFNDYVKQTCKLAGLTEIGRLSTSPKMELWECISSHTARRSFATNFYLDGFPTIDLMKITGHRTEKAFLRYIRIGKLDTAKRMNEYIKKNWSAKLLRVAS